MLRVVEQAKRPDRTFVTVAMPVLNEDRFVRDAIMSILPKDPALDYEVLVLDGGSTDRTVAIVSELAKSNPRIKLRRNEKKIQSAAINLAAKLADPTARVIVRADCHAVYPERFVETCLSKLAESGAQSVVVTMDTAGTRCFQRGVAAAQNSLLGNGGSAHRRQSVSGFVDHGHHAAFDRAFLEQVGGYDETLPTNEDYDLDTRIGRAGGRIWLESSVPIRYYPRDTMGALFRQYLSYGNGRALTYLRHRYALRPRQVAPLIAFALNVLALGLAMSVDGDFAAIPLAYVSVCLGWGAVRAVTLRDRCVASMGIAAMIMHNAWAVGFLQGLLSKLTPPWQIFGGLATREVRK